MLEQKFIEVIDQLSAKIGIASEKIWEWALLQVKVDIYSTIGLAITTILFMILFVYVARKTCKHWDAIEAIDCESVVVVIGIVALFVLIVMLMATITQLHSLPKLIINPEYAAFQKILSELGKLK